MSDLDLSGLFEKFGDNNKRRNTEKEKKTAPKTAYQTGKIKPSKNENKSAAEKKTGSYTGQNSKNESERRSGQRTAYGKGKDDQPNWDYTGYVGAPYNFIPISEKTYDYEKNQKEKKEHNRLEKELLSGCVTYQIQAKTPILIDSGKKDSRGQGTGEFYRDANGNYAIPGSSVRGLVRSNAQILSFSEVGEDIDDYNLMYRNVASGMDKNLYGTILGVKQTLINNNSISVLMHVKAGYIAKKGKEYIIYRTKIDKINASFGEMNYYIASEKVILEDYQRDPKKSKFRYLYQSDLTMQYAKDCKFKKQENWKTHKSEYIPESKIKFNGRQGGSYHPFFQEISYELSGERKIEAIGSPETYIHKGYLLSSGAMNMKKVIYIIPEIDREKDYIVIPEQDADSYKRDFEAKKTQIKGSENFFSLPQDGEEKPVFYIEYGGKLYFGFTPRLRLFYGNSVKKGYRQAAAKLDYCKALFGYTGKENSYKSRLSFQDASTDQIQEMKLCEVVLGSPKPTSYLDYIEDVEKPGQKAVTYNNEFRLRGVKQYWLKEQIEEGICAKNENIGSKLKPLPAGTVFIGKVRFHNLTKDELGLLLWSLELNQESEQNIGKAKAYGYGRVKIVVDKLELFDLEKAYNPELLSEQVGDFLKPICFVKQKEKESYIQCFKDEIKNGLGIDGDLEKTKSIRSFLLMKDSRKIPVNSKTRYMQIEHQEGDQKKKNEFQDRVKNKYPLPSIEKVIETSEAEKKKGV